ncbi:hypothetical protein BS47DRAFT_1078269 [Hydnum rufescens UP504]|uniref:Uncharacterized protein n=1 Tax=Hydnum rufescens UP504 TaxID=1448309 RepID=A0A9P6DZM6_9AGAM|nr:hypothetical protein BS47DRAFT_1078269 [Hydnum rufescens UP504]
MFLRRYKNERILWVDKNARNKFRDLTKFTEHQPRGSWRQWPTIWHRFKAFEFMYTLRKHHDNLHQDNERRKFWLAFHASCTAVAAVPNRTAAELGRKGYPCAVMVFHRSNGLWADIPEEEPPVEYTWAAARALFWSLLLRRSAEASYSAFSLLSVVRVAAFIYEIVCG